MMQSSTTMRRSRSPGPVQATPDIKICKLVTELNHALEFASQYHSLQALNELNDPITCPSFGVNLSAFTDIQDREGRKRANAGYHEIKTAAVGIVDKNYKAKSWIKIDDIARNSRFNAKRPLELSNRPLATRKTLNNVHMVQSQLIAKDLSPIDELCTPSERIKEINQTSEETRSNSEVNEYEENQYDQGLQSQVIYSVSDKKYTKRQWQEKFYKKPEIPEKVVVMRKVTAQSPLRDSQIQSPLAMSKILLTKSQNLRIGTSKQELEGQYEDESMRDIREGSDFSQDIQTERPLPYFQYSPNRLSRHGTARSQSPTSSGRKMRPGSPTSPQTISFKDIINSQLHISKNKTSSTRANPEQSPARGMVIIEDGEEMSPRKESQSKVMTKSKMTISQKEKTLSESKKAPKYVIVDAGKRYGLPRSPTEKKSVVYKNEADNLKESLRQLNKMLY